MSNSAPLLAFGQVMHRRLAPRGHRFAYPVFYALLPMHRLDDWAAGYGRAFAVNRAGLLSLRFADYGRRDGSDPRSWVRDLLAAHGLAAATAGGALWLQTFPRMVGYVFNPVSFWYCFDPAGALRAVVCEVSNTFGERHNYLATRPDHGPIAPGETLAATKVFHVSPFFPVSGGYRFRFHFPAVAGDGAGEGRWLSRIEYFDAAAPADGDAATATTASVAVADAADPGATADRLHAALSGQARPLSQGLALSAFLRYPAQTLGVMARIHWHALQLWLKGVPFFKKPLPPSTETTR